MNCYLKLQQCSYKNRYTKMTESMNTNKCKGVANFQIIFILPIGGNNYKIFGYFLVCPSEYLTNSFERNRICYPNENTALLLP